MQVDKITLQDIGLFDQENQKGLISHLNYCKTNGGAAQFEFYLTHPLATLKAISERQEALAVFIRQLDNLSSLQITNGTSLVLHKFYETGFKTIPSDPSIISAYWYCFWDKADYSLLKYSVEHLVLFIQNLQQWLSIFEKEKPTPIVQKLVSQISNELANPMLEGFTTHKIKDPQKVLKLGHFFLYQYKDKIKRLLQYYYEIDAMYSMAKAMQEYQFEFPNWIESEKPTLQFTAGFHPLVAAPICNDLCLSNPPNFLFLTGANMAGKSTFIKTVGVIIYLAHIGMGAPAKTCQLTLMDGLITNLTIADNITKGESYFYNEVQRIKNTTEKISDGKKYCILIDELFKGTNIQDAMKCSTTVVEGLQKLTTSLFILSTHLYEISDGLRKYNNIQFSYFETIVKEKELSFQYLLKPGVSNDRIGYLILEREGVVAQLAKL
jgi:DNA mismatch repair protein MutS